MILAAVLTLLAIAGVVLGVLLGQPRRLSNHLGAAGGGLLLGIAAFWLVPEIAVALGWGKSLALAAAMCALLAALDRIVIHGGYSLGEGIAGPLLVVTAVHSFLDGWSIRAAAHGPVAHIAVPLGLALHKVPEGLGLGWIVRRRYSSVAKAILLASAAETFTLAGAFIEPSAQQLGVHHFGVWWTALVIAAIAGTFAFLGLHAVWPGRHDKGVMAVFLGTLLILGTVASFR